jgi:hypothetical protein
MCGSTATLRWELDKVALFAQSLGNCTDKSLFRSVNIAILLGIGPWLIIPWGLFYEAR